ncbi:MAG: hypothetical protein RLZZ628_367, partial [Bacteroidota bacterium]
QQVAEFSQDYIQSIYTVPALVAAGRDSARNVFKLLEQTENFIDKLSPGALVELPVGIKKRVGNTMVMIGISRAKYYKDYSELTIFCQMTVPQNPDSKDDKKIFFGADNVRFTHLGNLIGTPKLVLLGDINLPINGGNSMLTLKGGMDMNTGNVDSLTFVKFNCSGVEQIGVTAELAFSRGLLVPLDANLDPMADEKVKVKGTFKTVINDWNDMVATISLPPFAIKGLEKVGISVANAVFDFSDYQTPASIAFPVAYQNMLPPNKNLWRGVYLSNTRIYLPKEFKTKNTSGRVYFQADSLLVDNLGLTGRISVNNVFQTGTASKWDFSVDKFEIEVLTNSLRSAGFAGAIALPITKKPANATQVSQYGLPYRAIFTQGQNYLMTVSVKDTVQFDVWSAKAKLLAGSFVELRGKNDQFEVRSLLNGNLGISTMTSSGKSEASFKGIVFQNLQLQTMAPRCAIGYLGYVSPPDTAGNKLVAFPISINSMTGRAEGDSLFKLNVVFGLNLSDGTNRFFASSDLTVVGNIYEQNDYYSYQFREVLVNSIAVDANFSSFALEGRVNIHRNHPVMGTGFNGAIKITLGISASNATPIKISSSVAFGRTTFRYWYVDALATGFNLPIGGGVSITGLGGGAWQNMKRGMDAADPGAIPTGLNYVPNSSFRFGFRAMTDFQVGAGVKPTGKGRLMLEMTFTPSMGVEKVILVGNLNFVGKKLDTSATNVLNKIKNNLAIVTNAVREDSLREALKNNTPRTVATTTAPTTTSDEEDGSIRIKMGMEYNVANRTFDANFSVALRLAGGMIVGRGANDVAGEGRLYIAPDKWYLHVGKPSNPVGVSILIPRIASINTTAYYMLGTELEQAPPVPGNVLNILGASAAQSLATTRNLNALSNGKGLSLGAAFSLDVPEIRMAPLYARFNAGVGFDIMVSNYGGTTCVGSSEAIGMNGWYASGKAYAYLQGELGIQVSLWFFTGRYPIIQAGAAVLLQAQMPKPSWFGGYLAGNYSLLGNRVRGSFSMNVELGERCTLQNTDGTTNPMEFITDFVPEQSAEEVDVLAVPQAVFRAPINEVFTLELTPGQPVNYRSTLRQFTLTNNGAPIAGTLRWATNNATVFFETTEMMPANTLLKATVEVGFEQSYYGSWVAVYRNGALLTEKREITFKTGNAPGKIPLTNLAYTYPVVDQKYFFPAENNVGVIRLKRNLPNILGSSSTVVMKFTDNTGVEIVQNATYDNNQRELRFTVPTLSNSKTYQVAVFVTAAAATAPLNYDNLSGTSQISGSDGFSMVSSTNVATSLVVRSSISTSSLNSSSSILNFAFGTSQYNTFAAKMQGKVFNYPDNSYLSSDVATLSANVYWTEPFDIVELKGTQYTANQPLIRTTASLDDYYSNNIKYLLYDTWATGSINRNVQEYGIPPVRAVVVQSSYSDLAQSNPTHPNLYTKFPYRYLVHQCLKQDFTAIVQEEMAQYWNNWDSEYYYSYYNSYFLNELASRYYMNTYFPVPPSGNYRSVFSYQHPNGGTTSSYNYNFVK